MIILHDLDGVHANWQRSFAQTAQNLRPDLDLKHLDTPSDWNMTLGQTQEVIDVILHTFELPGFYRDLEPMPGGVEAINLLQQLGHENYFVSSPYVANPTCASDKFAWVNEHYGPFWAKRLILTNDKTLVDGDILIDDKPEMYGMRTPTWKQVLFTQPYNLRFQDERGRIDSWDPYDYLPVLDPSAALTSLSEFIAGA